MERRIGRIRYSIWAFDVESHADEESVKKRKTGIWLSSFINEKSEPLDESNFYYSIEDWLDRLNWLCSQKRTKHKRPCVNHMVYIFNLAFEWSFILPVLLRRGFSFKAKIGKEDEYCFNSISTKTCSSVWQAKFKFSKNGGVVVLRDLGKVFTGSLRALAKSFGLPTQKGEIDYKKKRTYEDYIVTDKEKIYCFKDTKIIMDMLVILDKRNDRAFWSSVSAASYSMKTMLSYAFPKSHKPMKDYKKVLPELTAEENDFCRHAVSGGITYATPAFQFVDIEQPIGHIDFHQSHPSRMANNFMPIGKGTYHKGKPYRDLSKIRICHVMVSYTTVKLHSVIQLIGLECITDYELWIYDFEIPTMFKCYDDLEIEYIDYWEYKAARLPWRDYYRDNYSKRLVAKKEGDSFGVMYYKLLNNASYGKYLERGHNMIYENYVTETGAIDSKITFRDTVSLGGTYTHVATGGAIPAYSRVALIEAALTIGWKKVVYFDTDSIFYIKDQETEENVSKLDLSDNLGAFGREPDIVRGQFTCAKRYKVDEIIGEGEGFLLIKTNVKMAGVTLTGLEGFDTNIVDGAFSARSKSRVDGGTIIMDVEKQVQVQPKYEAIYRKNRGKVYN